MTLAQTVSLTASPKWLNHSTEHDGRDTVVKSPVSALVTVAEAVAG